MKRDKSPYSMTIPELETALKEAESAVGVADRECQAKHQELLAAVIREREIGELIRVRMQMALDGMKP